MDMTTTRALGRHLLIEYYDCCREAIDDRERIRSALLEAARLSGATIVTDVFHDFNPHGISGVVVIAESHVAIHTWPEHGIASVDVFSCGEGMDPSVVERSLFAAFRAGRSERRDLERGVIPGAAPIPTPVESARPEAHAVLHPVDDFDLVAGRIGDVP